MMNGWHNGICLETLGLCDDVEMKVWLTIVAIENQTEKEWRPVSLYMLILQMENQCQASLVWLTNLRNKRNVSDCVLSRIDTCGDAGRRDCGTLWEQRKEGGVCWFIWRVS